MEIKRGEIVWAQLEPVKGSEQGGIRPVLIIQNDYFNDRGPTTIIAPLTSKIYSKEFPTNVFVEKKRFGLTKDSTIMFNQIRTIDKIRITKKVGMLDVELMKKVDFAIKVSLDIQ